MNARYERKLCTGCGEIKVITACYEACNRCRNDIDLKVDALMQAFCLGRPLLVAA